MLTKNGVKAHTRDRTIIHPMPSASRVPDKCIVVPRTCAVPIMDEHTVKLILTGCSSLLRGTKAIIISLLSQIGGPRGLFS